MWFKKRNVAEESTRLEPCEAEDSLLTLESMTGGVRQVELPQPATKHPLSAAFSAVLSPLDRLLDWVYGSRLNPLYQSGALAVFLFMVVIVTGVYLLFFYKVSAPYESVSRLHNQLYAGRWIRALHRYASDAAMVVIFFHVLRMIAHGRTWGPRALAWVSGLILTGVILLSGWTGQVMVWDAQAQLLAIEGGKLFDLLPIFSEPVGRAFVSNDALPQSFFFLNLFLHVSLPLGAVAMLWIHVSRVARPLIFPPKALAQRLLAVLVLFSIIWPPYMLVKADLLRIPTTFAIDWFFCFWLPVVQQLGLAGHAIFLVFSAGLISVPWWLGPRREERPPPSYDHMERCQGCDQCWQDCPFEAIQMVPRSEPRGRASERVALVEPSLCVSCGLCSGSCAPMAIGPPNRIGRVQLEATRMMFGEQPIKEGQVVVLVCGYNDLSRDAQLASRDDTVVLPSDCTGALHTSVIEQLLRYGAAGVFIVSCPGRNCVHREGPKWLFERVYNDREAELPARVDRSRICLVNAAAGERMFVLKTLDDFRRRLSGDTDTSPPEPEEQLSPDRHRPSIVTSIGKFFPRLAVTILFLVLLVVGNRTPVGQAGTDGVLRLAWRLSGEKIETCRELTAEELASKPQHMRQPRECKVQPLSYRLTLTIDGEQLIAQTIAPPGARGDRPLFVQHDVPLGAGSYVIDVDFAPLLPKSVTPGALSDTGETKPDMPRHLVLHSRVNITADQITLIDYDDQAEALVVIDR